MAGLLGKPQISLGKVEGSFCIRLHDVENFYHLIDQRIRQQNRGQLIQFTATIKFNDGSAAELPSLEALQRYSEIRPLVSIGLSLTWIYLVIFPGSSKPEKQQIDVDMYTVDQEEEFIEDVFVPDFPFRNPFKISSGLIRFRVSYTVRSWGADIENLLSNHIQSLIISAESKVKRFILRWYRYVTTIVACVFWFAILSIIITLTLSTKIWQHHLSASLSG
jgi:hypothetical protein